MNNPTLSGSDAGKYIVIPDSLNNTFATIFPRLISVTGLGQDKTYDGTDVATVTNLSSDGVIAPDDLTFTYTDATFQNPNVANDITIDITGIDATGTGRDNYLINEPGTARANITQKGITVTATGQNKVYDGNTNAQVTLSSTDIIAGDIINFSSATANFVNKNVADDIDINVTGISKSGTNQGNYTLLNTTATTKANITRRPITITATGQDKVYDGTTDATVTLNASNIVPGELIIFTYGSATFATVGPDINIPITVTNITTSDTAISNYTFNDNTTTIATIFAKNIPNPNPESPDYLARIYTLQSLAAALQKPFTGCLYHSYDRPLTRCLFREYEPLNLFIIAEGIRLPRPYDFNFTDA